MKKTFGFFAVSIILYSCSANKEIQVNMVNAELVKIDTITRYPYQEKVLVWKGSNNVEYISYAPINRKHIVGEKMPVMVQR